MKTHDASSPRTRISYQPWTLAEFAALPLPELTWVVDELLPQGALALFAGREKSGKSLLMTDLAACVATGETFLNHEVTPGPVILVPAEENPREVRARLESRLQGALTAPLHILQVNQSEQTRLDLANPDCLAALREMCDALQPRLLILDPFRELHNLPENDADAMGPLLRPLRQLAHDTNVAIILTHHMSRSGTFRGSTAIRASCDLEWAFRRPEEFEASGGSPAGTVAIEGRFGPRQRLGIRLGDALRWHLALQVLPSKPTARAAVVAHLQKAGEPVTAREIAVAIGRNVKTVQNNLTDLKAQGVALESGQGERNDPYRYRLDDEELAS